MRDLHRRGSTPARSRFAWLAGRCSEPSASTSQMRLGLADQGHDLVGVVRDEQALTDPGVAEDAADAGEHLEVGGDGGGDEEEEESGRLTIHGSEGDPFRMAAEGHDGVVHQADERVAGVGQGDAVADAGAVELFAFLQGIEKGLAGGGMLAEFRHCGHEFAEDTVAVRGLQPQEDGTRRDQLADENA